MNALAIGLIVVTVLCLVIGCSRGLFRSLLITLAAGLALVGAWFGTPRVSSFLQEHTQLDEKIETSISEHLQLNLTQTETKTEQMQAIEALPVPETIKMAIVEHNYAEAYLSMQVQTFQTYVSHYLAEIVVNGISFLGIQVTIMLVCGILLRLVKDLDEIPIFAGADKIGGLLLGGVQALIIIWTFFLLVTVLGNTNIGIWAFSEINQSPYLNFLYENNIMLKALTDITKIL